MNDRCVQTKRRSLMSFLAEDAARQTAEALIHINSWQRRTAAKPLVQIGGRADVCCQAPSLAQCLAAPEPTGVFAYMATAAFEMEIPAGRRRFFSSDIGHKGTDASCTSIVDLTQYN
jgi:hypothetical protein